MAACVAPFAVVGTTVGFQAAYDPNGNMVLRVENGVAYQQEWDAENRLAVVTHTVTGQVVRFVYDGDGNRILRIGPDGTTVYIGDYYEKRGSAVTKYYYVGGQRVAVWVNGALYFLHTDHLGSATLTTDASGGWVGEARYTPFGEMRRGYPVGVIPTDHRYTGQRWDGALSLYDYRARYYDPVLGRFISADTIVPEPGNPQALNRYTYGRNNPVRHVDPSGHIANDPNELARADEILQILLNQYGVAITKDWGWLGIGTFWDPGSWRLEELETVLQGVKDLANLMGGAQQFRANLGGVQIMRKAGGYLGEACTHKVWLRSIGSGGFMGEWEGKWTVVHELAHAWDAAQGWALSKELERYTGGRTALGKYYYGDIPPKGADANFTREEDFAESVATFIYPATAQAFIQTFYGDRPEFQYANYYVLPRAVFVAQLVNIEPQRLLFLQTNRWGR